MSTYLLQSSGQGSELAPLVAFYSKLPKGPAPPPPAASLKAKFFDGKNASGKPLVYGIIGIFLIGYTLDYQSAYTITLMPNTLLTLFMSLLLICTRYFRRVVHLSESAC